MAQAKAAPAPAPAPKADDILDDGGAFSGKSADGNDVQDDDPPEDQPAKGKADRVKVTIGDQELEVDAAAAAVITSMQQMNQEMAAMIRNGYKTPAAPAPAPKDEYDYETELFTNPKGAIERLRAEIKAEVKSEMTGQYNAAESQKAFWAEFYSSNKELADEKLIVNAVLQRDWAKLKDMDGPKAAKALAEASKREIMRLTGGKSPSDPDFRPAEGGSGNKMPARKDPPKDEDAPKSLSDIIRARQQQRRNAQYRKTKE